MTISPLPANRPLLEPDLTMSFETRKFMNLVAALSPITGSGSPEGIYQAKATRLYMDTDGVAGAILYVKQVDAIAGDGKSGWVLV
jgi:hypothetical protein